MNAPTIHLLPNAAEPQRERLEWLTDLLVALDGTEVSRPMRAYPRYTYSGLFSFFQSEERQLFAALREQFEILVPLSPHVFRGPKLAPDAGLAAVSPLAVAYSPSGVANTDIPVSPEVAAASLWMCPVAPAWLNQATEIEHLTSTVARARLSFQLVNFEEAVPAYSGPTSAGLFLLPVRQNWSTTARERINPVVETADFGNLRSALLRHSKRSVSFSVLIKSRAELLEFRSFLFAMEGRAGRFRWTFGPDGVEKTWRLAQDVVEIEYLNARRGVARVSLEFVEV